LDVSTIDLVAERFRLWGADDAPLEEQNDLILEILQTSPQKSKRKGKDRKSSKSEKAQQQQQQQQQHMSSSPPSSHPRMNEWASLGVLGRMMGITTPEERGTEQQQQPTQVRAEFSAL